MSSDNVSDLMREWFALKAAQTAKKRELSKFHETYQCKNMQSNGYLEMPEPCIYRSRFGRLVEDACEPCEQRHNFYMQRQENAHKRTAILNRVRYLVNLKSAPTTTAPQDKGEEG